MRPTPIVLATLALAVLGAACGSDENASGTDPNGGPARTIEIEMQDNRYVPDTVSVDTGEPVRFVFTNNGEATHDAFVGDEAAQDDHEDEMNDDMNEHGMDDDTGAITVEAGEKGGLTHTFEADDDVLIGCHEPGHYDGGMRLKIDVT